MTGKNETEKNAMPETAARQIDPGLEKAKQEIAAMMSDATEQASEIVENAKQFAQAIMEEAKNANTGIANQEIKEKPPNDNYLEEYVEVTLFQDNDKYKDDVFVAVNGENCLIQRGKPVRIKRKFALALASSDRQDIYAAQIAEQFANNYRDNQKVLS